MTFCGAFASGAVGVIVLWKRRFGHDRVGLSASSADSADSANSVICSSSSVRCRDIWRKCSAERPRESGKRPQTAWVSLGLRLTLTETYGLSWCFPAYSASSDIQVLLGTYGRRENLFDRWSDEDADFLVNKTVFCFSSYDMFTRCARTQTAR